MHFERDEQDGRLGRAGPVELPCEICPRVLASAMALAQHARDKHKVYVYGGAGSPNCIAWARARELEPLGLYDAGPCDVF